MKINRRDLARCKLYRVCRKGLGHLRKKEVLLKNANRTFKIDQSFYRQEKAAGWLDARRYNPYFQKFWVFCHGSIGMGLISR